MNVVLVTGASSGIGEAICACFLAHGWRVLGLSRRPPALPGIEHIALDLAAEPGTAWPVQAELQRRLAGHEGRLVLVHNAGEFAHDTADAVDAAYLERAFRVMVAAPAWLNTLLAPRFTAGSAILYVGSTLSELAVPGAFSYAAVKHAVVGMMRATQQDMGRQGVHSCCICPGVTATPMVRANTAIDADFLRERTSFGRLVEPAEIADLAYFCAVSPVVNGAVLHANLGQLNR